MKTNLPIALTILCVFAATTIQAQGSYIPATNVPVTVSGSQIKNPWVGGFNAPMFSEIDLNNDGVKDLFVFDREGDRITTYINNGTPNQIDYVYAPEYRTKFPKDLHGWALLKDYNCDGLEDIFTYSYSGGMTLYRNDYTVQGGLKFTMTVPLIMSKYGTIIANLYVASVNLPALADVDYDGDIDVLTFPVSGNYVEYHQNQGMDLYGTCDSVIFHMQPNCFGNFGLSGMSNTAILNVNCRLSNPQPPTEAEKLYQTLHSGSCMIAVDLDGDADYDLLNGDILGENILAVYNGGTSASADMTSQDDSFPSYDIPVDLFTFPAPYYLDVNNDGKKDFLAAPCMSGPAENYNHIWYYRNTTNNLTNVFDRQKKRFLVDEMIEVGAGSNVVYQDIDSDGLMDMIVGNYGYFTDILPFESGLAYYRNVGTATQPAFELITPDFGGFFSLTLTGLAPAFGDIDTDGDADLMLGNSDGNIVYYTNTAGPGNFPSYVMTQSSLLNNSGGIIDVGQFSTPQLVDVNKDGKTDLLIGEKSGNINYYENTGSSTNPEFSLMNANFGGIMVNNAFNLYGYSYPCFFQSNGASQLLVGAVNGYIYQYANIDNNLAGTFTLVDSMYKNIHETQRVTVAIADLTNDGIVEILTGNNAGGITLYKYDTSSGVPENNSNLIGLNVYPNPTSNELYIKFDSPVNTKRTLSLIDITGRVVEEKASSANVFMFDVSEYSSGVYVCRVIEGNGVKSVKFVVK